MRLRRKPRTTPVHLRKRAQRGFGIISAIFLVVVLAGLGAAMANLSIMQHAGAAMNIQEARAYQAARAGIEWGLYDSLIANPGAGCPAGATSFTPPAPTLSGFTVTITCLDTAPAAPTVTSPPIVVRQLTVIACTQPNSNDCPGVGGTADYVERRLQVTFQR